MKCKSSFKISRAVFSIKECILYILVLLSAILITQVYVSNVSNSCVGKENKSIGCFFLDAYAGLQSTFQTAKKYGRIVGAKVENPEEWYYLGLLYNNEGDRQKVAAVYDKLKSIDPQKAAEFYKNVVVSSKVAGQDEVAETPR